MLPYVCTLILLFSNNTYKNITLGKTEKPGLYQPKAPKKLSRSKSNRSKLVWIRQCNIKRAKPNIQNICHHGVVVILVLQVGRKEDHILAMYILCRANRFSQHAPETPLVSCFASLYHFPLTQTHIVTESEENYIIKMMIGRYICFFEQLLCDAILNDIPCVRARWGCVFGPSTGCNHNRSRIEEKEERRERGEGGN